MKFKILSIILLLFVILTNFSLATPPDPLPLETFGTTETQYWQENIGVNIQSVTAVWIEDFNKSVIPLEQTNIDRIIINCYNKNVQIYQSKPLLTIIQIEQIKDLIYYDMNINNQSVNETLISKYINEIGEYIVLNQELSLPLRESDKEDELIILDNTFPTNRPFTYYLNIILISLLSLFLIYLLYRYHKISKNTDRVIFQLDDYIHKSLLQGYNLSQIEETLKNQGYHKDLIKEVLLKFKKKD